jgi:phosphomannomutase
MSLISSISGIRGTVGAGPDNLNPETVMRFAAAFGRQLLASQTASKKTSVIIGRDARVSGLALSQAVAATLQALGINVIDIGLATTPTVEMAVIGEQASGGIIVTASHNPAPYNALKLLNATGEFLSDAEGRQVLELAADPLLPFSPAGQYGSYRHDDSWTRRHIEAILKLPAVKREAIAAAGFKIAVEAVNSVGGLAVPELLGSLGVLDIVLVNCAPDGNFAHNPEPLAENLSDLIRTVTVEKCALGVAVDPDVDRLALVCEDGTYFGEEYTLVAVSDYILSQPADSHYARHSVSNLSSSRALRDVSARHDAAYSAAPVGEVNVVTEMRATKAVIGGEGNGGVIYPELHYGRDALVGIALILSYLAESRLSCLELRHSYPDYYMSKNKLEYPAGFDISSAFAAVKAAYPEAVFDERDGLKLDLPDGWLQLRRSNTEPIVRVYAEAADSAKARALAEKVLEIIKKLF